MEPIVSPSVVYLIALLRNISAVTEVLFLFGLIVAGLLAFGCALATDGSCFSTGNEEYGWFRRWIKYGILTSILCGFLCMFIPTRAEMVTMLIAKNVTQQTVQDATKTVEKVYGDIMRLLEEKKEK